MQGSFSQWDLNEHNENVHTVEEKTKDDRTILTALQVEKYGTKKPFPVGKGLQ
jgi:hypothetical protein